MDFLIVEKLVNNPPGHLSVMYGISNFFAASATIDFACFFVATNNIFLPDLAICFIAAAASSSIATVLFKSIICIPFCSINTYGAIAGLYFFFR